MGIRVVDSSNVFEAVVVDGVSTVDVNNRISSVEGIHVDLIPLSVVSCLILSPENGNDQHQFVFSIVFNTF